MTRTTHTHAHTTHTHTHTQHEHTHTHTHTHLRTTSDKLFRVNDVAKRKKYAALVEGVQAAGGEALVFSSMHVSGGRGGSWGGGEGLRGGGRQARARSKSF